LQGQEEMAAHLQKLENRAAESMWAGPEFEKRACDEDRSVTATNPSLFCKPQGYLVPKNESFFLYGSELQEQEEMAAELKQRTWRRSKSCKSRRKW
jgi:hypothetical protein